MVTNRPTPGWEAPSGMVHEPMVAQNWRILVGEKRCRFMESGQRCGASAVAMLNRERWSQRRRIYEESWWAYCPDHMYGRWIEDDRVLQWRVVPIDEKGEAP